MTSELSQSVPRRLSDAEARSDRALTNMLANLDDLNRWIDEIDRERGQAMQQRGQLKISIEAMLRAVPYEVQRRHREHYTRAHQAEAARPRKLQGALGEVIRYLVENDFETVRGADLMHYLKRLGVEVNPRYAGKALSSLAEEGMVRRLRHGVYAINQTHPDLVALRLDTMEKRRLTHGRSDA